MQGSLNVKPPVLEAETGNTMSLPAEMTPPSPAISPFERPTVAARFQAPEPANTSDQSGLGSANELARLLADALRLNEPQSAQVGERKRPAWDRRKVLICTSPGYRDQIANGLAANDYEVFVADNTPEALGRMREDRIDVLVLDANFDPVEQGFAFVTREVKLMRPSERRRLFLIYLTPSARTMDLHGAFLQNVNLVVNPADLERLPEALEISIRHYNELYRGFNRSLDVAAI
jgi:CheY-like chemotaxis protein